MSHVRHIDRKFLCLNRNTDIFLREDVFARAEV